MQCHILLPDCCHVHLRYPSSHIKCSLQLNHLLHKKVKSALPTFLTSPTPRLPSGTLHSTLLRSNWLVLTLKSSTITPHHLYTLSWYCGSSKTNCIPTLPRVPPLQSSRGCQHLHFSTQAHHLLEQVCPTPSQSHLVPLMPTILISKWHSSQIWPFDQLGTFPRRRSCSKVLRLNKLM